MRSATSRLRLSLPADRRAAPECHIPGQQADDLKAKFEKLNKAVNASGDAWITSIPGAAEVAIECLPGSALPDELRAAGYDLCADGWGERILPTAITERFTKNADGSLGLLTQGSTQPVTSTVSHAGIVKVLRFRFLI